MNNELLNHQADTNSTKLERKRLKKQRKREQREQESRKEKTNSVALWVAGIGAIGAFIFVGVFFSKRASVSRPGKSHHIEGREHVSHSESIEYKTNPPTSGAHYADPIDWGVYGYEVRDEQAVHSLEHGGIWISYKDADEGIVDKLERIGRKYPNRTIVSPRSRNDSFIAIASWGRLLKLDVFDEEQIVEYIKKNTNKSPEKIAR